MSGPWARKMSATALGLGYLPGAPGTWTSAAAALVHLAVLQAPLPVAAGVLGLLCVLSFALGLSVCRWAQRYYADEDPRTFVMDEAAGYWAAALLFLWWRGPWQTALAVFLAFRLFDVAKPFPVRRLERLPRGWGVMLDDVGAAMYSAVLLWPLCYLVLDRFLPA